jgi:hypothetical protein
MGLTKLRKEARGKECQIRLEGICNFNPETTVLCHYRMLGVSGMGMKSPDWLGAWGCSDCHRAVDGQMATSLTRDELRLAHAEGVFRTLLQILE